jgi:hypothetical protein
MQIPADQLENDKKLFFNEITTAINKWLLEKYPLFDSNLENKIKQLDIIHKKVMATVDLANQNIEKKQVEFCQTMKIEINNFLNENYPDLTPKLSLMTKELEKMVTKYKNFLDSIEKQAKPLTKAVTLYEDIYKLRDEFSEFKKEFESYNKKMKKVFG